MRTHADLCLGSSLRTYYGVPPSGGTTQITRECKAHEAEFLSRLDVCVFRLAAASRSQPCRFYCFFICQDKGMAILYSDEVSELTQQDLEGFFVGWANPPTRHQHLRMLQQSTFAIVARDGHRVVGYLTALSDGVLFACISGLEVLPEYRGKRIGHELVRMALAHFKDIYAVDLVCEPGLQPFYEKLGFAPFPGTCIRNSLRTGVAAVPQGIASLS